MNSLIWLGVRAAILSLILTPIFRDIFRSYGVVDEPDSGRKTHPHPIPRVGGIAVFISYFVSLALVQVEPGGLSEKELALVWSLLPAALVVFGIGLIDDFWGLKPWQKIAGQLAAAGLAYSAGIRMQFVAGHAMEGWWSLPLTILWLLLCTNAFNLVDGLDGLAAGVGLFATATMFTAAILQHNTALACATLPLAGCLLGFLCYNFNPATIFLGDGGSLLIGFLLGCFGVAWSQKSITLLGMTAPLMALSIPLADVLLAIVRRFLRRQPIFGADRGHIHHRLIDLGLTPRRAVLLVYAVCGLAAGLSLLQSITRNFYLAGLVAVLFSVVCWIGVHYLRYSEFTLAGRFFRTGEFHRSLNAQLTIESFTQALLAAEDVEACWKIIRQYYRKLGYSAVHLHFEGVSYREWRPEIGGPEFWTMNVPLSGESFIEFAHAFESPVAVPTVVSPVADMLRSVFAERRSVRLKARAAVSGQSS
jgi:UDP-GlcNAc:undecaprenyl-phosphate/decaprenyl-phosphate GlcNAc-1-phosphate transferase